MFVFSPYFPGTLEIQFSHVLGIVWISVSGEMFKRNVCVFLYFSLTMGIHFPHEMEILIF